MHAKPAKAVDGGLSYLVRGYLTYEESLVAIVLEADSNICFATSIVDIKAVGLDESAVSWRRETQHNLSHSNNLCHISMCNLTSFDVILCKGKHYFWKR